MGTAQSETSWVYVTPLHGLMPICRPPHTSRLCPQIAAHYPVHRAWSQALPAVGKRRGMQRDLDIAELWMEAKPNHWCCLWKRIVKRMVPNLVSRHAHDISLNRIVSLQSTEDRSAKFISSSVEPQQNVTTRHIYGWLSGLASPIAQSVVGL